MQASAQRLDPTSEADANLVVAVRQNWHPRAWLAYGSTGEVKGGARFMENACSRVKIVLAISPGVGEDPVDLKDAVERGLVSGASGSSDQTMEAPVVNLATVMMAEDITTAMVNGQESDGALLAGWGNKSFVVGECYVVGYVDVDTLEETWICVSARELQVNENARPGESRYRVRRMPGTGGSVANKVSGATDFTVPPNGVVIRVWRRDAEWGDLSDSNLRACLNECEELSVLGASIKAQGMSRIPANILYVADEIKPFVQKPVPVSANGEEPQMHPFLKDMIEHMTTPVRDPGSVASTVPFLMTGPGQVNGVSARDMIFMVEVGRPLDPQVVERCNYLIARIANTVELPSERLTGMGGANHWTAWQIDEETYRLYVAPTVDVMLGALTRKYLRARLVESGIDRTEANRFVYIADPGDLVAKPNRGANAQIAHDAGAINNQALRDALGFKDDDAPSPEEVLLRIISRQTVLPVEVIPLLNQLLGTDLVPPDIPAADTGGGTPAPPGGNTQPAADQAPNQGEPADPIVASARRRRSTGERLMAIDRRTRERILAYSESAVARKVERAGARLRTSLANAKAGTTRGDAKAMLAAVPNRRALATLGRVGTAALGVDEGDLLDGEFDDLRDQFDETVSRAQEEALAIAVARLGIENPDVALQHVRAHQEDQRRLAWAALAAALLAAARNAIYDTAPHAVVGEVTAAVVQPGMVRQALAIAGGSSPVQSKAGGVADAITGGYAGGVATGDDMAALWGSYGEPWTGYEWQYNYDGPSPFLDHEVLGVSGENGGGVRFASWDDEVLSTSNMPGGVDNTWLGDFYFPGDHFGCQCDAIPVFPGE